MRHSGIGRWAATIGLGLAAAAGPARAAGWSTCMITHDVLLVPAKAAGLTGLFILDAAQARSQLDATQATLAGLVDPAASVSVMLGGMRREGVAVDIAPLDARTRAFPTQITGVLGADVLSGQVLEVRPNPCRFRLSASVAGGGRIVAHLPIVWRDGVPLVQAGVSDGPHAQRGLFAIATGDDMAVRLSPAAARMEGAPAGATDLTAPLRGLSLGGLLIENAPATVADTATPGRLGAVGEPVWARYALTLDLMRGKLTLAPP